MSREARTPRTITVRLSTLGRIGAALYGGGLLITGSLLIRDDVPLGPVALIIVGAMILGAVLARD